MTTFESLNESPDSEPIDHEKEDLRMDSKLRANAYSGEAEPEVIIVFAQELAEETWKKFEQGENSTDLLEALKLGESPVDQEAARIFVQMLTEDE